MLIGRINDIDRIWNIKSSFEKENKIKILNVSDWNCSEEFKDKLQETFRRTDYDNAVEYIYSYNLPSNVFTQLKKRYPFCLKSEEDIMVTPNNTVSIIYVVNLLKQLNLKRICVVAPTYFSVYNALDNFNLNYDKISIFRKDKKYILDKRIDLSGYDAVWVTSPIFCGGVELENDTLKYLENIANDTLVITDESFCKYGKEIPNRINLKHHIGIYSPHKSIGFNAFKFSVISYNKIYSKILEHWSDVLCGSLNITNYEAIRHFLSPNFMICQKTHFDFIKNARENIFHTLNKCNNLSYDNNSESNMMMIYASKMSKANLYNESFFKEFMSNTMGLILPGYLHDYNDSFGFCFRINLLLYNSHFQYIFNKICSYIN